jgi:hypothetical protein
MPTWIREGGGVVRTATPRLDSDREFQREFIRAQLIVIGLEEFFPSGDRFAPAALYDNRRH